MTLPFWNIGKANAEIARQRTENDVLKAAAEKPSVDSANLAEALATNEKLSAEITQLQSDLDVAVQSILTLGASRTEVDAKLSKIHADILAACAALKIEAKADSTDAELISAMQTSVTTALSRVGVPVETIPAGSTNQNGQLQKPVSTATGLDLAIAYHRITRK